jgi:hypothetical protein
MRSKPEADGIPLNFNPHMASRVTCTPFEENHRIKFEKATPAFEGIPIQRLKHFCQAAFLQHTPGILSYSLALCLINFGAQYTFHMLGILVRNIHHFLSNPVE